jgi:hypothetical protein
MGVGLNWDIVFRNGKGRATLTQAANERPKSLISKASARPAESFAEHSPGVKVFSVPKQ